MSSSSREGLLSILAFRDSRIWDYIHPHVPMLSEVERKLLISMAIKNISKEIKNPELSRELYKTGEIIFSEGRDSMSYDDELCPPFYRWPVPFPFGGPQPDPWRRSFFQEVMLNPQPLPPVDPDIHRNWVFSALQAIMLNPQPLPPVDNWQIGGLLTDLANTISNENVSTVLRDIALKLVVQNNQKAAKDVA